MIWRVEFLPDVRSGGKKFEKKGFTGNFGKTGPEKCLYCDLQTCECFKELRRAHVQKHFVFEWVYLLTNFLLFSMGNATFLIFAKDVPMTPIKYA